jgi:uncharacterized membrane protein
MMLAVATLGLAPRAAPGIPRAAQPVMKAVESPVRPDRNGRIALAVLASAGAVETATITSDKLGIFGGSGSVVEKLCSSAGGGGGCGDVLNSPWADVGGVPLALFGAVAYSAVALLAAAPLLGVGAPSGDEEEDVLANALVFGSGALAAFSSCLMVLLLVVIKQSCILCFGSAALSLSIFAVAWRTLLVDRPSDRAILAGTGALISLAAAATLYFATPPPPPASTLAKSPATAAWVDQVAATCAKGPSSDEDGGLKCESPPVIQARSSPRALELARQLQARGGKFYGAFWCGHCRDQKETLGAEAMKLVPYMECAPDGAYTKRTECQAVGIKGYPTWILDGKQYPGERSLDQLEDMLAGKAEVGEPPN